MDTFFEGICRLGIFMICAQAIVHFRPNGSYEKYMKLLVSVMLLIQIFLPIAGLFAMDGKKNIEAQIAEFEARMQESMERAAETAAETEDLLERMTLQQLQERVAQQKKQTEDEYAGEQQQTEEQKQTGEQQQSGTAHIRLEDAQMESVSRTEICIDEIVIEMNP